MQFASQDMSHYFEKENLTALFGLIIIFCAMVSSILVSRCFSRTKHSHKIIAGTILRTISYTLVFVSYSIKDLEKGFWINIAGSAFFGCCCCVDHTVFVGYLKSLPPYCYKAYASAEGFSGFFTVIFYLVMKYFGINVGKVFLIFLPTNLLILALFFWIDYTKDHV